MTDNGSGSNAEWARPVEDVVVNETAPEGADWARRQLVAIDDELRAADPADFARRGALQAAADGFRQVLRSGQRAAFAAAREQWESRAGRKGAHEVDTAALEALARRMPGDGGAL